MSSKNKKIKKLGLGAALVLPLAMLAGYATYAVIKPPSQPTVETDTYADIGDIDFTTNTTTDEIYTTSATIYFDYVAGTNDSDLKYRIYKTGGTPPTTWQTEDVSAWTDGEYSLTFDNLTPNTSYTIQAYLSDGVNSGKMESFVFTTGDLIATMTYTFDSVVEKNPYDDNDSIVDGSFTYTVTANESEGSSVEMKIVEDANNNNTADSGETIIIPIGWPDTDNDGYYNSTMIIDGASHTVDSIFDIGYYQLQQNTNYVIDFQIDNFHSPAYHYTFRTGVVGTVNTVADDNDTPTLHNKINIEYNYIPNASAGEVEYQVYFGTDNTGTIAKAWTPTTAVEDDNTDNGNTDGSDDSNASYDTYSLSIDSLDDGTDSGTDPDPITASTNYYVEFKVDGTVTGGGAIRTKDEPQYEKVVNLKVLTYSDTTVTLEYGVTAGNQGAPADVQFRIYESASFPSDESVGWQTTPKQDISANTYTMTLTGLKPNTEYKIEIGCDVEAIPGVIDSPEDYPESSSGATGTIVTTTFTTKAAGPVSNDVYSSSVQLAGDDSANITYQYVAYDEATSTDVEYRVLLDANGDGDFDTGEDTTPVVDWTPTTAVETSNGQYNLALTGLTAGTKYIIQFSTDGGTTVDTNSDVALTTVSSGTVQGSITNATSQKVTDTSAEIKYYYQPNDNTASDDVKFTVKNSVTGSVVSTANNESTSADETAGSGWYTITAADIGTLTANTEYVVEFTLGGVLLNKVYFTTSSTSTTVPASIYDVQATAVTSNSATISFVYEAGSTAINTGAGKVEVQVNNHGWELVGTHSSGSTSQDLQDGATESFTINTLDYATTYRLNFRVDGVEQPGTTITVTTSGDRATLTSATLGTVTATSAEIAYVTNNPTSNAPGIVSYSIDGGITWVSETDEDGSDDNSTLEITGLTTGTYYEVFVTVDGHQDEIITIAFITL